MHTSDWNLWDSKAKQLDEELDRLCENFQVDHTALTEEVAQSKERLAQLRNSLDRQVDFLLATENQSNPLTPREHAFLFWVRTYAQRLSGYVQDIQKTMQLDFWVRLVYTRATHMAPGNQKSADDYKSAIENQMRLLRTDEESLNVQLEGLEKEEAFAAQEYREITITKANKDALASSLSIEAGLFFEVGSQLGQLAPQAPRDWADRLQPSIVQAQLAESLPTSEGSSVSSHGVLATFDTEDLTHSL